MGDALKRRIRQETFESPQQEAMLNVIVAANHLRDRSEQIVAALGLTLPQFNVLRILRGAQPHGHPRSEIASRMLDRAPDVTRIIDRLEEKQLVARDRAGSDRRQSITRITAKGLRLLDEMEPRLRDSYADLTQKLSANDCRELSRLCELIYG